MARIRWAVLALAVVLGGVFNQGCLGDAGSSLAKGGLDGAKQWLEEKLAAAWPSLEAKAIAAAEAALEKREQRELASIDAELLKVAPADPATGGKLARKALDFDIDKSGHLEPGELLAIQKYVTVEGAKRVAEGRMTAGEFTDTEKKVGGSAGVLGTVAIGYALLRKRKKAREAGKPPPAAGPDPSTPAAAPGV